jgi:hypothetical protein
MPVFKESVEVIASDLQNTTWIELYELWQKLYLQQAPKDVLDAVSQMVTDAASLHERIQRLAEYFPRELY